MEQRNSLPTVLHSLLTIRFGVGLSARELQPRAGAIEVWTMEQRNGLQQCQKKMPGGG